MTVNGRNVFEPFGYRSTLDSLAGGDITKYEYIQNLPYNDVFVKLVLNKEAAGFQKRFAKLQQEN